MNGNGNKLNKTKRETVRELKRELTDYQKTNVEAQRIAVLKEEGQMKLLLKALAERRRALDLLINIVKAEPNCLFSEQINTFISEVDK
jgi:hypothetical protein